MGRQHSDPNSTMVKNSSIALLQERFRQLEKVKERREEKQLLRLLSSSETNTNTNTQQRLMVRSSYEHDSLSLGLNLTNKQGDKNMKSNSSLSQWSQGAPSSSSSTNFDASDVDTSLHL